MNGLFLSNILNFPRYDQNEQVRFALFDLVNRSCSDLGPYDLSVQTSPSDFKTTVAFLRFDTWTFHAEAVVRLNRAHLSIPSSTTSLPVAARINRIAPPPGVAEAHRRNALTRAAALARNTDSTHFNRTLPTNATLRQSRRTLDSTPTTTSARPRPTSVKRLRLEPSTGHDRASHSTAPSSRIGSSSWAVTRPPSPTTTYAAQEPIKTEASTPPGTPPSGQAVAPPSENLVNDSLLKLVDDPIRCSTCVQLTTLRGLAKHRDICPGPSTCSGCMRTIWNEQSWSVYPCGHVLCDECSEQGICHVCPMPGHTRPLRLPL